MQIKGKRGEFIDANGNAELDPLFTVHIYDACFDTVSLILSKMVIYFFHHIWRPLHPLVD